MTHVIYPAILFPKEDATGLVGVTIPGINVNASGTSTEAAVADAVAILQEVLDDLSVSGEAAPEPLTYAAAYEEAARDGGSIVYLQATLPGRNIRVNIMLPEGLVKRIDTVAPNRSAFLAEGALHKLRHS